MLHRFFFLTCILFSVLRAVAESPNLYETIVTFPADFTKGDYITFLKLSPEDAAAGGYYEVSISYLRGNIAAASTHLAAIPHAGPNLWREAGRINDNIYSNINEKNFTVDVNTAYGESYLRIRAINNSGIATLLPVHIKVRSIGITSWWLPVSLTGHESNPVTRAPMTATWDLWVGSPFYPAEAKVALRADMDGNVCIGTMTPKSLLTVAGTITSKRIKVVADNWPDYVFDKDYKLPFLQELSDYVAKNKHLPGIPAAAEILKEGQDVGEMNKLLLRKVEELTLYLIAQEEQQENLRQQLENLKQQLKSQQTSYEN